MAVIQQPESSGFEIGALAPTGTFIATCLEVQDQFGVDRPRFENPQEIEKLDVTRFLFGFKASDGQLYKVQSFEFRISGSPKSNLIKFLTSWLGHQPKYGWDYCELKTTGAMITVAHKQSRDLTKTYANIVSIAPVIDQLKTQVLPPNAFPSSQAPTRESATPAIPSPQVAQTGAAPVQTQAAPNWNPDTDPQSNCPF